MAFPVSVQEDYKLAAYDGGQSVTFTAVRAANTNYAITYADDHDLSAKEIAASGGVFNIGDKRWALGNEQITVAADKPQPGDKITDASSVVWWIIDAVLDDLDVSWYCTSRKAR